MMRHVLFVAMWLLAAVTLQACSESNERRVVGFLESDRVEVTAENAEPITRFAVVEGQSVRKGGLLVQQDTARIEARIDEAEAILAQSRARLDELTRGPRREQIVAAQANVDGATRELEFRRREYERAEKVFEQHLSSREVVDQAQAAVDTANAELEFQEARLQELLEGTTVEELRQAENAMRAEEAQLALLQVDARRHSAYAPADGIVDSILFEPGERPLRGQPMMIFLTGQQPYARVYVPEALRVSVAAGTTARVFVDGLATPLNGRVRWVSSDAAFTPYFALTERDRGRLSFAAKVDILDAERRLPDGIPVEVEFRNDD
ncbi:MAG: HlyD family secretion protein [Woeseiaceae bacterium]